MQEMVLKLNDVVVEMAYSMFDQELKSKSKTDVCSRPGFADRYVALISLGNKNFHGRIVIGIPDQIVKGEMFQELLEMHTVETDESEEELIKSAIGEFVNVVGSDFIAREEFVAKYGNLNISLPLVWDSEIEDFPLFTEQNGIQGSVEQGEEMISTFISVSKLRYGIKYS
ncbi:MAG: hypothetical protein HRT89_23170 [Lentisphaeria bacterium]|nr:hypothetical protein [Lentisphaeria bacterium]NQZ70962.1 hypothetical protein [Lentisphaeria bacterium]